VSNTYCVVFLICLSSSCVPYVAGNHRGRDRMVVGYACEFEPRSWRDVIKFVSDLRQVGGFLRVPIVNVAALTWLIRYIFY
jgi:hypothetical protein